ncbi:hypothetical protein [Streptomyces sp. NPDC051909]|uniref:hypothetical protein n=1 Tax=Streptomyces sp. NPDC051909 TaxID=3154944 RepID=UPI003440D11C
MAAAALIAELHGRPVADSRVRALVDVADARGWRRCTWSCAGTAPASGQRVTAAVVDSLAAFLEAGCALPAAEAQGEEEALDELFSARQLPCHRQGLESAGEDREEERGSGRGGAFGRYFQIGAGG